MKRNLSGPPKRPLRPGGPNRPGPPTDLIALGSKTKGDLQRSVPDPGLPAIKKVSSYHGPSSSSSPHHSSRMSPTIPEPSVKYIDVLPNELVKRVTDAMGDVEAVGGMICGAIRNLRGNRLKPDQVTMLALLYLAKKYPTLFRGEGVVECIVGLLKKDVGLDYIKSKENNVTAVVACNLLMAGFEQSNNWPSLLVKVFIEDSLGDRIWVDHPQCRKFVTAICTAFHTLPSPEEAGTEQGEESEKVKDEILGKEIDSSRKYFLSSDLVRLYAIEMVRDRVSRRQGTISAADPTGAASGRNLLRTLTSMCGIPDIRSIAAHKLEIWLQSPKLTKPTQDLLMSICINCRDHNQDDVDVIGLLTRMRLKTKALLNHYTHCLKHLIDAHKDNMGTLFSYVIYNELSNARNPTNMSVIAALLQHKPKVAAEMLATVCQDLLLQQEDYLRAVRALVREIVRIAKHEVYFPSFALGIMKKPDIEKFSNLDQAHKERFVSSTSDLICLIILVSASPSIKESIAFMTKNQAPTSDIDHEGNYHKHKMEIAAIQRDAIWWLHVTVVPLLLPKLTTAEFSQHVQKVLFLKSPETYYMKDNWPPESERTTLVRHCADIPVLEDTIMRLAVIGLSHEHPLAPAETLDLIGQLVRRAGALGRPGFNPVPVERTDIIDTLLSLSQYHHPENIKLPSDYLPPSLAISLLYWTAWQTLLILSAFNIGTVGLQAWTEFPTLKSFMEMAIVNSFVFPLATISDDNERSQVIGKEMQMIDMEKNEIIEFESHLAAATTHLAVTEDSSLLLSQLIAMNIRGPARRPPEMILNQTRAICSQIQIGASLCRSREPDFLLEIINRHSEDQAMPWLSGLVSSARGDMSMLPVQCLCEYLLVNSTDEPRQSPSNAHENEIIAQIRNNLLGDDVDESVKVINYFLRRLHSPQYETRLRAKQALSQVLNEIDSTMQTDQSEVKNIPPILSGYSWLLRDLPSLNNFKFIRSKALDAVLEAIMCESDPVSITAYAAFLSDDLNKLEGSLSDETVQYVARLSLGIAHLLIDRQTLVRKIVSMTSHDESMQDPEENSERYILLESLLSILLTHLNITRKGTTLEGGTEEAMEEIPWRDTQDEIFLRWPSGGGTAQLHILVSQAMILLLTLGSPFRNTRDGSEKKLDSYMKLMYMWFNEDGSTLPKAYLMDTQEEALLLPDWLRLRLLHCKVTNKTLRLSIAGSKDVEVKPLLLFIQSFGIPYIAMDRLLKALDEFCVTDEERVSLMTKDNRIYLTKLVEGQWKRGCCNGTNFHALLSIEKSVPRPSVIHSVQGMISDVVDLTQDQSEESDVIMISSPERPYFSSSEDRRATSSMLVNESSTYLLQDLFMSAGVKLEKDRQERSKKFRNLMRSLLNPKSSNIVNVTSCVSELHALVTAKKTGLTFLNGLYAHTHWSCSLLRILDSSLRKAKGNTKTSTTVGNSIFESIRMFEKVAMVISTKCPAGISTTNSLFLLSQSWTSSQSTSGEKTTEELGQLDWARLEEFLRKQLAFLERDEEIKTKVALVAQILLEEIGSRKAKASRGKSDLQNDKFYSSVGTTGLLIDWLQILDPELLAHRPILQRKLLFETQRSIPTSMPLKMSAKMSNHKYPQSLTSHQTYLLSLLTEHSNWETVHKCLQWLLSDSTCDPTEKSCKAQSSSAIKVDAHTAMDFLWVCMHTSKIWKGRENKSTSLAEPVFFLDSSEFCHVLVYMVSASMKQTSMLTVNTGWNETVYFELFLVFYTKFGQKELKAENFEKTVDFVYKKATDNSVDMWWSLLAQLYILEPFHDVWSKATKCGEEQIGKNSTLAKTITSTEVGSICKMDALIQMLLDRIGYVRESGRVDTRDSVTVIQSSIDIAYDASLLLRKLASCCPSIVLRQLALMLVTLSGRTWYEFREFKTKNHMLFMSQLCGILEAIGPQLFNSEYAKEVDQIFETYFQMLWNYCNKARRQMKEVMYNTLRLVLSFLQRKPYRAYHITNPHTYVLQGLMNNTYSDHDYIVSIISKILTQLGSAALVPAPTEGDQYKEVVEVVEPDDSTDSKDQMQPFLRMIEKDQDLENVAQVLAELSDTGKRKIPSLEPFLPHLIRLFSTCRDSSIRHSALNATVLCMRSAPSRSLPCVFPTYLLCLTGSRSSLVPTKIAPDSGSTDAEQNSLTSTTAEDEIARDALDFLPDMVVLCREQATRILEAAFDCGSKNGVGVQPPGTMGVVGTPIAIGGNSTWQDLSELLAKSLTLLSGLSENSVKAVANGQS